MVIAIDGPAGAGKSTVARALARELGFAYLDSGAMYRCVALLALQRPAAEPALLARAARIEFVRSANAAAREVGAVAGEGGAVAGGVGAAAGEGGTAVGGVGAVAGEVGVAAGGVTAGAGGVLLDGRDVTSAIRTAEVSQAASRIAADPGVRSALVATQRALLADGDWVAEGRDIGTVVAPAAELKIFLTASENARALRRARESGADLHDTLAAQRARDARDASRAHSPLRAAADAIQLDTSGMVVEEVVRWVAIRARARMAAPT